ncbi:trypsin epsilon-like [Choristoneura fumiferana]|uniref:trypsin epsilon-like n=1 Tax=Choristoneura fumiferana TaxID=7141 RepID=UPI003D15C8E8
MSCQISFTLKFGLPILLSITVSLCNRAPIKDGKIYVEGKIVGGHAVPLERFPYTVQVFNYGAMCAGSIFSSWSVLTAAHCFENNQDVDEMELHVGSRYTYDLAADRYNVWYYVAHEDYNKAAPFACDVAVIFVDRPIRFSEKTSKAVLVNTAAWMSTKETNFTATGWGWTKYGGPISTFGLLMTELQYVSAKECGRLHNLRLTRDMFCLYGDGVRDTCKGDSGGGIEWRGMIVGIVSHGDGCAKKDKPSVYSNVWYFRKWIDDQIDIFLKKFCNRTEHEETNEEDKTTFV